MTTWNRIARFAARPAIANWLIRRAMQTPYTHLPSNDNPSYMARYWVFNPYDRETNKPRWFFCPWSIRIHHIKREDRDRALHDHPWNARTIILKGWYEEKRLITGGERDRVLAKTIGNKVGGLDWNKAEAFEFFTREPGDTAKLAFEQYHQVTEVSEGGVWTLFISGPWQGVWGFLVDAVKIPWKTYLNPTPEHACIYCGGPHWDEPADQGGPPPDYCHESDHGSPPEFASGGYVGGFTGLPDGEIPAILPRGERVLLPSQAPMWDGCNGSIPTAFPERVDPAVYGVEDEFEDLRQPRTAIEWAKRFNPNKEFGKLGWKGQSIDCEKLRIADQRRLDTGLREINHPLESITEWRKGCSCAPVDPADCNECTTALINAIEGWYLQNDGVKR